MCLCLLKTAASLCFCMARTEQMSVKPPQSVSLSRSAGQTWLCQSHSPAFSLPAARFR